MLQKQDTDLGLAFYFNMYVYNNAGHFVLAKTPEFSIPSPYPPAQAVVIDLDPENVDNDAKDVDAHFKLETVCAKWYGFHHPEDIAIEFGVGTRKGLDDIINFKTINFTNTFCLVSSAIPESLHVFVTLRATSSGGSTISSSDGTTIYNSSLVLEQLMVNDGPDCFIPSHLVSALNHSNEEYFVFAEQLKIGKTYTLLIFGDALPGNDDSVQSPDVRATNIVVDHKQHHFIFTPFTEYPRFFIAGTVNGDITTELYDCEDDLSATSVNHSIFAHWRSISDHLTFETAVVKLHCLDTLDDDCLDYQSPFLSPNGPTSSEHIVSLQIYESYYVAVKPCLNSVCLRAKLSSGVTIEPENLIIDITQSAVELTPSLNCSHVRIKWQKLIFIHAPIYQWSVATRVGSETSSVIKWRNTKDNEIFTDHIKVKY